MTWLSLCGLPQAEPVTPLDEELGYACSYISLEDWSEGSITYVGLDIRSYANLAATTCLSHSSAANDTSQTDRAGVTVLALLGVVTLITRYRGQGGGVVQVIRRDGGIHYLSLLGKHPISRSASHHTSPTFLTP